MGTLVKKLIRLPDEPGEEGPKAFEGRNLTSFFVAVVASCDSVLKDVYLD